MHPKLYLVNYLYFMPGDKGRGWKQEVGVGGGMGLELGMLNLISRYGESLVSFNKYATKLDQ